MRFVTAGICNDLIGAKPGHTVNGEKILTIPCRRAYLDDGETPALQIFVVPDSNELAGLLLGKAICITFIGGAMPPIQIGVLE